MGENHYYFLNDTFCAFKYICNVGRRTEVGETLITEPRSHRFIQIFTGMKQLVNKITSKQKFHKHAASLRVRGWPRSMLWWRLLVCSFMTLLVAPSQRGIWRVSIQYPKSLKDVSNQCTLTRNVRVDFTVKRKAPVILVIRTLWTCEMGCTSPLSLHWHLLL